MRKGNVDLSIKLINIFLILTQHKCNFAFANISSWLLSWLVQIQPYWLNLVKMKVSNLVFTLPLLSSKILKWVEFTVLQSQFTALNIKKYFDPIGIKKRNQSWSVSRQMLFQFFKKRYLKDTVLMFMETNIKKTQL